MIGIAYSRGKPRKKDFADMREFMRAAATWAEANMNEWPWGGPKDDDDDYCFVALDQHGEASSVTSADGGGK